MVLGGALVVVAAAKAGLIAGSVRPVPGLLGVALLGAGLLGAALGVIPAVAVVGAVAAVRFVLGIA
jgi:hypothetical protein